MARNRMTRKADADSWHAVGQQCNTTNFGGHQPMPPVREGATHNLWGLTHWHLEFYQAAFTLNKDLLATQRDRPFSLCTFNVSPNGQEPTCLGQNRLRHPQGATVRLGLWFTKTEAHKIFPDNQVSREPSLSLGPFLSRRVAGH